MIANQCDDYYWAGGKQAAVAHTGIKEESGYIPGGPGLFARNPTHAVFAGCWGWKWLGSCVGRGCSEGGGFVVKVSQWAAIDSSDGIMVK